ncbi:ankyrin repeat domain-containing protein [Pseudomonas qingdaonensis]|nr:ankyrin repeat domain-containing protein [Pseudomonas qingdaonensis]
MKKVLAVSGIAALLAGCGSSYQWDEVTTSKGSKGKPTAIYVDKKTKEPVSGTIIWKEGDTLISEFKVKNGKVQGDWVTHNADGSVAIEAQLDDGQLTGTTTVLQRRREKAAAAHRHRRQEADREPVRLRQRPADPRTGHGARRGQQQNGRTLAQSAWRVVNGEQVPAVVANYDKDGSGQLDGVQETFYPTGQLQERKHYNQGKLEGLQEEFVLLDDGTYRLRKVTAYKDGQRDGDSIQYFVSPDWPEKTVEKRETYAAGQDTGKTVIYRELDVQVLVPYQDVPPNHYKLKEALAGKSTRDGYVADVESLKYLLQASDIDLNKPLVAEAELPVHYVAENAYDMLVSLGADPLKTTAEGNTRLMMCLKNAWRDCSDAHFDQLLALSNAKTANLFGNTPLHELCKSNSLTKERPELGQRLIASQDINAVNYAGQTALHYCITQRDKTVANALIAAGADLDKADYSGVTPMQLVFLRDPRLGRQKQVSWDAARIQYVGGLLGKSTFNFEAPFPASTRA